MPSLKSRLAQMDVKGMSRVLQNGMKSKREVRRYGGLSEKFQFGSSGNFRMKKKKG